MSGSRRFNRGLLRSPIAGWSIAASAAALALSCLPPGIPSARADAIPTGWQASKLELVGFSGLDGRPGAFKLAIRHAGDHCVPPEHGVSVQSRLEHPRRPPPPPPPPPPNR